MHVVINYLETPYDTSQTTCTLELPEAYQIEQDSSMMGVIYV